MTSSSAPFAAIPRPWPDAAGPVQEELGLPPLDQVTALHWALALQAQNIPHKVRPGWPGYKIQVPPGRLEEATTELRAFARENPSAVEIADLRKPEFTWGELPGVLWSLSIVTVFLTLTGAENTIGALFVDWHHRGGGDTGLMAAGQWWRAFTSLTLHADIAHLVGNVVLGGSFLLLLARQVGLGTAWFLAVYSAGVANMAKLAVFSAGYRFLGSSTAVFAALGALAGVRLVRLGRQLLLKKALPFAAGVMILAFLGVGTEEEARKIDLAGHFMGFGAGFVFGALYALLDRVMDGHGRRLSPWLGLAAAALMLGAWAFALLAA